MPTHYKHQLINYIYRNTCSKRGGCTKLKHSVRLKNAMLLNIKIDGFSNRRYALKGLMIRIIHRHSMFDTSVGVVWRLFLRNLWSIINLSTEEGSNITLEQYQTSYNNDVLATNPGRNRPSGRHTCKLEDNIKMDRKWVGRVEWINLKDETYVWWLLGTF